MYKREGGGSFESAGFKHFCLKFWCTEYIAWIQVRYEMYVCVIIFVLRPLKFDTFLHYSHAFTERICCNYKTKELILLIPLFLYNLLTQLSAKREQDLHNPHGLKVQSARIIKLAYQSKWTTHTFNFTYICLFTMKYEVFSLLLTEKTNSEMYVLWTGSHIDMYG